MDNIYLVGYNENMKTAFQALEEDLCKLLLRINFAKSWSQKPITGLLQDVPVNPNPVVMKVPPELRKAYQTAWEQGSQVY